MGQPDADLIQRWQQGDRSAFEALVRRWQDPIAKFLARQVGQLDLVQDLCQEVFLRLYLAGARYRESGVFSTWLYRIALNVARDAARRGRTLPRVWPEQELAIPDREGASPCEQQELAEVLTRALAELPPALREVLVLRHYEAMNFEEMSRLLRVPASTLKSRFAVALGRLRLRLQQLGWSSEDSTS